MEITQIKGFTSKLEKIMDHIRKKVNEAMFYITLTTSLIMWTVVAVGRFAGELAAVYAILSGILAIMYYLRSR